MPKVRMGKLKLVLTARLVASIPAFVRAQGTSAENTTTPTKLSDLIWQLGDVEQPRPTGNPYDGHQNSTMCCLMALSASLAIDPVTGLLVNTKGYFLGTGEQLRESAARGQFPCAAKYNGDPSGAPVVEVPYEWLDANCPGWQLNDRTNLNSWLQSLSGFLIPAVPLIFSIPRRRKLQVNREFFLADLADLSSYLAAPLGAIGAAIIVTMDSVMWLALCFAFAAPMILSGLYEAVLDNRMLLFVKSKTEDGRCLTLDMRARCLMVTLIGNLDLALDTNVSPWRHMENMLYSIRLYDDEEVRRGECPRQWPKHQCDSQMCEELAHVERPRPRDDDFNSFVAKMRTRLRTMLHCQSSFGTVVGAPVIFFLGGFIFALLNSLDSIGDEDIAEALAFGQWYMIIPHISIVSGFLLAGNNPNILEGVFATEREEEEERAEEEGGFPFPGLHFGLAYPSCYKTAWQWRRGHSKKKWIEKIVDTYGTRRDVEFRGNWEPDADMSDLRAKTTLVTLDWVWILALTTLLVYVPFALAFLTSFYTPQIGLSCRSLTSTIYACSQAGQILLWFWANCFRPLRAAGPRSGNRILNFVREDGWLDRGGFFDPSSLTWLIWLRPTDRDWRWWCPVRLAADSVMQVLWSGLHYSLMLVFGAAAVFSVLGGTLMQLMGVYSANICYVSVNWWLAPVEQRPPVVISTNTALMIHMADKYWKPFAITAIGFLSIVSFIGWWYQRRMRDLFGKLVRNIDAPRYDRDDTRMARPLRDRRPKEVMAYE